MKKVMIEEHRLKRVLGQMYTYGQTSRLGGLTRDEAVEDCVNRLYSEGYLKDAGGVDRERVRVRI